VVNAVSPHALATRGTRLASTCGARLACFTTKAVESRRGAVSRERSVSPPGSSNRRCGFPASGFPTGFMTGSRQDALPSQVSQVSQVSRVSQSRHTKIAENRLLADRLPPTRREPDHR